MIGMYFTYSQVIDQPGRLIKVVAYPKWQFTCIVLFDVEVTLCCTPSNITNVVVEIFVFHSYQNVANALTVKR